MMNEITPEEIAALVRQIQDIRWGGAP